MISTLDPHVHNGERFMPACRRFLQAFYPWLNRELGIERDKPGFVVTYLQCFEDSMEWAPEGLAEASRRSAAGWRYARSTSSARIISPAPTFSISRISTISSSCGTSSRCCSTSWRAAGTW